MTTIDALLIGFLSALVLAGVIFAGRSVWGILKTFPALQNSLHMQYEATIQLVTAATAIGAELQYMRTLANAQAGQGQTADGVPITGYTGSTPVAISPFPSPIFDRFPTKPVPDAELGDTDDVSLSQTDEDMAQLEAIEKLRAQGIQIDEPDVVHPGVTVESE
jgi:hypothetical protein